MELRNVIPSYVSATIKSAYGPITTGCTRLIVFWLHFCCCKHLTMYVRYFNVNDYLLTIVITKPDKLSDLKCVSSTEQ